MNSQNILPAWAQPNADSFDQLGLIAERRHDGVTFCNLPIVGGLAGAHMAAQWDYPCAETEMLALSIVLRMTAHPDDINAHLAPFFTQRYKEMSQFTSLLDDGERVSAPQMLLAKHLQAARLYSDIPRDTLTLTLEDLTQVLVEGIRRHYG